MTYLRFTAENGDQYIFIGKNRLAIINDTNDGQSFGGEKFVAIKELSLEEVVNQKNFDQASAAIIAGSPSYLLAIIPPQ